MHPEILLINLDRSVDRLGLPFVRQRGSTPQDIDDRRYRELAWRRQRPMSRAEVACLLSHARAWRHVADSGRPALAVPDDCLGQRASGAGEPPPLPGTVESTRERRGFLGCQAGRWLTAPRCRLRRLAGVLTLSVRKARLRRRAALRPIASCATIQRNWLNQRPEAGATPPSGHA